MADVLPWLILGYIALAPSPRRAAAPARPSPSTPPTPTGVRSVAYIYRLPGDGYETTRMALAQAMTAEDPLGRPVEMGVFQNPAFALKVAQEKGWALAWPEVRELEKPPE